MEKRFDRCSVCRKKIGFFRRRIAKKQDKSGKFPITQEQFCSPKCANIGYHIILEFEDVKKKERGNMLRMIDSYMDNITRKRQSAINRYGSMNNIPKEVMPKLYPGSINILKDMKRRIIESGRHRPRTPTG